MNKIKNLFLKISEKLKDVTKKYPITMIIVLLITIVSAICLDDFIISSSNLAELVFIGTVWSFGVLLVEELCGNKKIIKYIGTVITLVISIFFNNYLNNYNTLFNFDIEKTNIIMINIFITYLISIGLVLIYKLSKQSGLNIKEYLLKVFSEMFTIGITYIILNIGIAAVAGIFIVLILEGEFSSIIPRLLILALGIFYVPSVIAVFSDTSNIKVNIFIEKILLYVILPLTVISIVIVYIYVAKILLLKQMPKNLIGRILIAIYCVAIPVWAMTSSLENERFNKIIKKIPHIYLPLIILEIYSIAIRIHQYGFTPLRYFIVLFIIFQLISLFVIIVRKEKQLRELIFIVLAISILYLISPLNYRRVSCLSQKNILDEYVESGVRFDECSEKEKERYTGAYEYLKNEYDSKKYINNELTEEDIKKLEENRYYYNEKEYVYENKNLKEWDIFGYSKIYYFKDNFEYDDKIDTNNIKIIFGEDEEKETTINISKFLEKVIEYNEEGYRYNEYFEENNIITIDNLKKIYITYLSFSYDSKNKIDNLNLEGYMLEK